MCETITLSVPLGTLMRWPDECGQWHICAVHIATPWVLDSLPDAERGKA